jgi:exodeoxyribonuclease VII large subunit
MPRSRHTAGPGLFDEAARPARDAGRAGLLMAAAEPEAYSVARVNALARELLEGALPPLWVAGEVTGWKRHTSGHCYFTLRDATAQLRCVMWRGEAQRLPADPDEGLEVRALGTLTIYERRGEYQLVVRALEASGAGGLWRVAFERLRARLQADGLLDPARKRPLPPFPDTIAVVTSETGAVLQDILHVLRRRAPWVRVRLCPARVQGDGAAGSIAAAIELAGRSGAELVIVARGGGSLEDLWAFNEEPVARAIAACPLPVVSAIGHETDVTIADLVADLRAPTPSAAAERAVPDAAELARRLAACADRAAAGIRRGIDRRRDELERRAAELEDGIAERLRRRRERLLRSAARLEALSPLAALRRGYAVPMDRGGRILRRVAAFQPGAAFRLRVVDGTVDCSVTPSAPPDGGEARG